MRDRNKKFHVLVSHLPIVALLVALVSCSPASKKNSSPKFVQYYIQGELLYQQHCSNCHQKNGKGLGLVYPPLDSSDYMESNLNEVICLIKNGINGEILVNGKAYNQKMQGLTNLTDLEIAEISTYIYNTWSHDRGLIDVNQVSGVLSKCTKE